MPGCPGRDPERNHADCRHPPALAGLLRRARTRRRPLGLARLRRPDPAVHGRRHGALRAVPHGSRSLAVPAGDERAEVHSHERHRRGRQDPPARHLLPDERQLLVRRLLQGGRHLDGVGAAHHARGRRRLRLRAERPVGHRLRRRRRGHRALEAHRGIARRAHPATRQGHELLAHRAARPGRPVLRDLLRPRPRVRHRRRPGDR